MGVRVYCHLRLPEGEYFTRAVDLESLEVNFGTLKRAFLKDIRDTQTGKSIPVNDGISVADLVSGADLDYQFYSSFATDSTDESNMPIPDVSSLATYVLDQPFVDYAAEVGRKIVTETSGGKTETTETNSATSAFDPTLFASPSSTSSSSISSIPGYDQSSAPDTIHSFNPKRDFFLGKASKHLADKSQYYYTHTAAPVAQEAWKPKAMGGLSAAETRVGPNKKQSPFGTDIEKYETIAKYSFEDHDSKWVKVNISLPDVGKLPGTAIESRYAERAFEVLVHGYVGPGQGGEKKNLRLGCSKTHEVMLADECKHLIRANRITLMLRKGKDGDIWFDLFKKKAIGDDDKP